MKIGVALLCAVLIFLIASQAVIYHRMSSLESALRAQPAKEEIVERRLAAVRRTVETLASEMRKKARPGAVLTPSPPTPAGASSGETPAASIVEPAEDPVDEEAGSAGGEDKGLPKDLPPPLAMRRRILEDIRGRLQALDGNADLQVSIREFEGDIADFLYFDRNSSGRISADELERVIATEDAALRRVAEADKDHNGQVSPDEFKGSPRKFRYLDENRDGALTVDEYVASQRRLRDRLDRDDLDDDRKLSKAEFSGSPAKFEKFDVNKDGFIDRSELKEILLQGHD